MEEAILSVDNLTIDLGGAQVVQGISLELRRGEILGLIGPSGAGKSTTIAGLLGLTPMSGGWITFKEWTADAKHPMPVEMKREFAYIPEQPMYYSDLTLMEHLEWKLRLWEYGHDDALRARMESLIRRFQLRTHMDKFPHQCSKGTLQKLMVVAAFLFPFEVLIVDEPFIGLDVIAIREIRNLIASARDDGAAVLVSTHVLDSAERMCQRFVFVMDGQVFAQGSLEELRAMRPEDNDASLEDLFINLFQEHARVDN